jgi:hypothetical protein
MRSTRPSPRRSTLPGKKTSLHRAIELAKSGRCRTTADVFAVLKAEGYPENGTGPWLTRLLQDMIGETAAGSRQKC